MTRPGRRAALAAVSVAVLAFAVRRSLFMRREQPVVPPGLADDASVPPPSKFTPASRPSEKTAYTNESLHDFLDQEQKRIGIRKILPRKTSLPSTDADDTAQTPPDARQIEENRARMRFMAEDLRRILDSRTPPSVALKNADTPALLAETRGNSSVDGAPMEPSSKTQNTLYDVPPGIQAVVIRSAEPWKNFWALLKTGRPLPNVDFTRAMVLALAPADPDKPTWIEIASIEQSKSQVTVHYRRNSKSPSTQWRVLQRTELPIYFNRISPSN